METLDQAPAILPYFSVVTKRTDSYWTSLTQTPEEARNENLKVWASTIQGVVKIADVKIRERQKVAGVITNIRIDPREGSGSIEATFVDGTGQMLAKWLGRQALQGITLGMGLIIEGTIGAGTTDEPIVLNPEYVLVPGPEHGVAAH